MQPINLKISSSVEVVCQYNNLRLTKRFVYKLYFILKHLPVTFKMENQKFFSFMRFCTIKFSTTVT